MSERHATEVYVIFYFHCMLSLSQSTSGLFAQFIPYEYNRMMATIATVLGLKTRASLNVECENLCIRIHSRPKGAFCEECSQLLFTHSFFTLTS